VEYTKLGLGSHTLKFRVYVFWFSYIPAHYPDVTVMIKKRPAVQVSDSMLPFTPTLSLSVTLPISVSGDPGDTVRVRYGCQ
jgi:hypothetical protein